jgi:hypothetical protein
MRAMKILRDSLWSTVVSIGGELMKVRKGTRSSAASSMSMRAAPMRFSTDSSITARVSLIE